MTSAEIGFYRLKDVLDILGIKKTFWYGGAKEGRFPRPVQIPGCTRGSLWLKEEIHAIVEQWKKARK